MTEEEIHLECLKLACERVSGARNSPPLDQFVRGSEDAKLIVETATTFADFIYGRIYGRNDAEAIRAARELAAVVRPASADPPA